MEGGETDDASNRSMHPHHLPRMSNTSPHSDSPHRRPAFGSTSLSSKLGYCQQSITLCSHRAPRSPCKSTDSLCIWNKLYSLLPAPCRMRRHFIIQRCQAAKSMELVSLSSSMESEAFVPTFHILKPWRCLFRRTGAHLQVLLRFLSCLKVRSKFKSVFAQKLKSHFSSPTQL